MWSGVRLRLTPRGLAIAGECAGRATETRRGISLKAPMGKEYTNRGENGQEDVIHSTK